MPYPLQWHVRILMPNAVTSLEDQFEQLLEGNSHLGGYIILAEHQIWLDTAFVNEYIHVKKKILTEHILQY